MINMGSWFAWREQYGSSGGRGCGDGQETDCGGTLPSCCNLATVQPLQCTSAPSFLGIGSMNLSHGAHVARAVLLLH